MKHLVVEFIGPNGSGKASVASLVDRGLRERGWAVNLYNLNTLSGRSLYGRALRRWLRSVGRYTVHLVRCVCLSRGAVVRLRPLVRKMVLMGGLREAPGVSLVDEGPGHTYLRLVAVGKVPHSRTLLRRLDMADIRVYMDADSDELVERLKGKHEGHWIQRLDVTERVRYLDRYRSCYWSILHDKNCDICVDTRGRTIEEVAAMVVECIVAKSSVESPHLSGGESL